MVVLAQQKELGVARDWSQNPAPSDPHRRVMGSFGR